MKRLVINSFLGIAFLAIAGCTSTMVPENTRDMDSTITSRIDESLEDSTAVKARQVNRGITGVTNVHNELVVGRMSS